LEPKLNVKVYGHQWFWSYEFNNWVELSSSKKVFVETSFDSSLVPESELSFGAKRLLEVDNVLVLPVNITIRFLISSGDVLHAWSVPEMGLKWMLFLED